MATSAPVSDVDIPECPVCQDEYTDPKILPCNHIVCRKCVLSWLQKEGGAGSCPVCRAPILPNQNPDPAGQGQEQGKLGQGQGNLAGQGQQDQSKVGQGQGKLARQGRRKVGQGQSNLAAMVDALPTDLALATFVESSQVLKGHRACAVCEESGVVATTYCLQCEFHLCQACNKTHKKYPAFREHQVEVMASLTREKVASSRRFMCQVHRDKPAEIYCSAHKELVCVLCILTSHELCPGKKSVQDVAKSERESLAKRASALREKETALTKQINQIKEKFKERHLTVKNTFDDLQHELEKRRQELVKKVKAAEDDVSKNTLASLEQRRSAVTSQASSIEHHVTSSPDHALLMMMKDLTSRLDDVETTVKAPMETARGGELTFETGVLPRLKNTIQNLGSVGDGFTGMAKPFKAGKLSEQAALQVNRMSDSEACATGYSKNDSAQNEQGYSMLDKPNTHYGQTSKESKTKHCDQAYRKSDAMPCNQAYHESKTKPCDQACSKSDLMQYEQGYNKSDSKSCEKRNSRSEPEVCEQNQAWPCIEVYSMSKSETCQEVNNRAGPCIEVYSMSKSETCQEVNNRAGPCIEVYSMSEPEACPEVNNRSAPCREEYGMSEPETCPEVNNRSAPCREEYTDSSRFVSLDNAPMKREPQSSGPPSRNNSRYKAVRSPKQK